MCYRDFIRTRWGSHINHTVSTQHNKILQYGEQLRERPLRLYWPWKSPFWMVLNRCWWLLAQLPMIIKERLCTCGPGRIIHLSTGDTSLILFSDLTKLFLPSSLSRGSLMLFCAWGVTRAWWSTWAWTLSPLWSGRVSWNWCCMAELPCHLSHLSSPLWPPSVLPESSRLVLGQLPLVFQIVVCVCVCVSYGLQYVSWYSSHCCTSTAGHRFSTVTESCHFLGDRAGFLPPLAELSAFVCLWGSLLRESTHLDPLLFCPVWSSLFFNVS